MEVTDCALGVDRSEGKVSLSGMVSTGVMGFAWGESGGLPTLEEASVKLFEDLDCCDFPCFGTTWEGYLFRVVDLPDDGLPTRPMRGSRGILGVWRGTRKDRGALEGMLRKIKFSCLTHKSPPVKSP